MRMVQGAMDIQVSQDQWLPVPNFRAHLQVQPMLGMVAAPYLHPMEELKQAARVLEVVQMQLAQPQAQEREAGKEG